MAIDHLASPCPVKWERQATGHFYIWSGCFLDVPYDLNDPALGLGASLNALYGQAIEARPVTPANDQHLQNLINFCTAQRQVFAQQVANAVNGGT